MKIQPGQMAPAINMRDLSGNLLSLKDFQGKKLMLSFYRYAGCPFCNLRVHRLTEQAREWQDRGLNMLAVFQSPRESILEHAGKVQKPFSIIPDPERELYKRYDVEGSWLGMLKAATRMGEFLCALKKGLLPGKPEGEVSMLPADFILDESGRVLVAYYGKDIGDHLPLEDILLHLAPESQTDTSQGGEAAPVVGHP